jgi:putative ATPase
LAGQSTLLFVDEIHRFNRAQQDGFLPFVEEGIVTLVGATTENPSFELNGALLSRSQVFVLKRLDDAALDQLSGPGRGARGQGPAADARGASALLALADGDGRYLLTMWRCCSPSARCSRWTPGAGRHAAETGARLRQEPRRTLQPHIRAA